MNRTSFAQELRHRVKATKTRRRESQANRDVVHTYIPFLSAINIDLIYSTFGSRITNEKTKRASYVQEFRHCVGPQKLTSGNGRSRLADHDVVDTNGLFLSAINTDLINCISGSRITHEPNEKSTICKRILSLRRGHKTHLWNGHSRPTMMLSTRTAIFFQLSAPTSSIVYLGEESYMS